MIRSTAAWSRLILCAVLVMALLSTVLLSNDRRLVLGGQAPAAPFTLGAWKATTAFKNPRTSHQSVIYRDRLYVIGGYAYSEKTGVVAYNDVQYAALGDDGTVSGGWRSTAPFQTARSGHSCVVYNKRLYVIAGGDGAHYFKDVQYAPLNDDGTIPPGGWKTSPYSLNVSRSVHASVVVVAKDQAYLYAVGGVGEVEGKTVHFDTVEFAPLNKDGSVGPWTLSKSAFSQGRSSPGCVVVNRNLYVIGGWGDKLEDIFSDSQHARVRDDGDLGEWGKSAERIEPGRYGHTTLLWTGCTPTIALALGGNAGMGKYLNDVQYAPARKGELGRWLSLGAGENFPTPRWGHSSVITKGRVYVIGGSGIGTFLNDVHFAPLQAK